MIRSMMRNWDIGYVVRRVLLVLSWLALLVLPAGISVVVVDSRNPPQEIVAIGLLWMGIMLLVCMYIEVGDENPFLAIARPFFDLFFTVRGSLLLLVGHVLIAVLLAWLCRAEMPALMLWLPVTAGVTSSMLVAKRILERRNRDSEL